MTVILISIIRSVSNVLIFFVLIAVLLSYFMSPSHPVRRFSDPLLERLLAPIRKFIPTLSGIDFSPLIFVVIVSVLERVLINVLT